MNKEQSRKVKKKFTLSDSTTHSWTLTLQLYGLAHANIWTMGDNWIATSINNLSDNMTRSHFSWLKIHSKSKFYVRVKFSKLTFSNAICDVVCIAHKPALTPPNWTSMKGLGLNRQRKRFSMVAATVHCWQSGTKMPQSHSRSGSHRCRHSRVVDNDQLYLLGANLNDIRADLILLFFV